MSLTLPSVSVIDDLLCTSAQPSEEQLSSLGETGVRHVINLALPTSDNAVADEGARLAAQGITYMNIPVVWESPASAQFLLFAQVLWAMRDEPVRSQGHVHRVAPHSGWSPPELYEIWSGRAFVYLQEHAADDPGRCLAIEAGPGEKVVVPPGWAHATVSADPGAPLTFGAWCDREYGFEYGELRARKGPAWFPLLDDDGRIAWQRNPRYAERPLVVHPARAYAELGLRTREAVYCAFDRDPESVQWVSEPARVAELWPGFEP